MDNVRMSRQKQKSFWRRWLTRWLVARLRVKSLEIRTYVLQALGKVGDESALPVILDAARDPDSTIRRYAVPALADMGGAQATEALIAALADPESDIRAAAVMALGEIKEKHVDDALMPLLDDEDLSVRIQTVIALGHLGSKQALPRLGQMMTTESNEWVCRYISQAIQEIEGGCCS